MSSKDRDERIRKRAHEIWENEGKAEGNHERHWQQAASEIDGQTVAAAKPAKAKTAAPAKVKTATTKPVAVVAEKKAKAAPKAASTGASDKKKGAGSAKAKA